LPYAEAIQLNLDRECDVAIWHQGVFGLGSGTLETLVEKLQSFDFAILVLTADDMVVSRDVLQQSPRDNVLLELGLFIGAIGRRRTFIVYDREKDIKIPSDLAGVTPATFKEHSDENHAAELGAACTLIKQAIAQVDVRSRAELTGTIEPETQFVVIADLMDSVDQQYFIIMFEQNISFKRDSSIFFAGELYELEIYDRTMASGGFSFDKLCSKLPEAGLLSVDLRNNISLTSRGKDFAAWLFKNGHKADYFRCSRGSWGTPRNSGRYEQMLRNFEESRKQIGKQMFPPPQSPTPKKPEAIDAVDSSQKINSKL